MSEPAPSLGPFIRSLPKVELHLHLEGSVQPATWRELARTKQRLERETEDWIGERQRARFRYRDFADFLNAFKLVSLLLESPADYALAATRLIEALAAENVKYAEITLAVGVLLWKQQPVDAVFEAVSEAAGEASARTGVRVNWIFDAIRQFGSEHARQVLNWAARYRSQGVVAFGIGGDEAAGPAALFTEVYREARDLGLHTTAHAGEAAGPESVRAAVEMLGAERIGHGLRAAEDPAVLALVRDRRVPLEVCLTSNVSTGVLARIEDHPLPKLLESGVAVTLSTDDPAMFGTTLTREYELAAGQFGLSQEQIVRFCETGIRAAFLSDSGRHELLAALHAATSRPLRLKTGRQPDKPGGPGELVL